MSNSEYIWHGRKYAISFAPVELEMADEDGLFEGLGYPDSLLQIKMDNYVVGMVSLSNVNPMSGKEVKYINWIEVFDLCKSKRMLHPIMNALCQKFGALEFESNDRYKAKYKHIGAKCIGLDDCTELSVYRFEG